MASLDGDGEREGFIGRFVETSFSAVVGWLLEVSASGFLLVSLSPSWGVLLVSGSDE